MLPCLRLILLPNGVPVDPDRELARRWLTEELERPGYQLQESWTSRALGWIMRQLPDVQLPGTLPGWASVMLLVLVLVAVAAVLAFASRDRWRKQRLSPVRAPGSVLEEVGLSARAYLDRAQAALTSGDHDRALIDGYRAIAAGAVERTLLDDRPGRTAHEVALGLGPSFPGEQVALAEAGTSFDAVRYGDHRAQAHSAQSVLDLEARLRGTKPVLPPTGGQPAIGDQTAYRSPSAGGPA